MLTCERCNCNAPKMDQLMPHAPGGCHCIDTLPPTAMFSCIDQVCSNLINQCNMNNGRSDHP